MGCVKCMDAMSKIVTDELKAEDFSSEPYWWRAARPVATTRVSLTGKYDVLIIGAGITGLRAAIDLARSGRQVVVCDARDPGAGASRLNAGFLGRTLKWSYSDLLARSGSAVARAVYEELQAAYDCTLQFIAAENIACFAERCGRFVGATSEAHLERLVNDAERTRQGLGFDYQFITPQQVRIEIATDAYVGGIVIPDLGSLHPGLYHKGLVDLAVSNGVTIAGRTQVHGFERVKGKFRVSTSLARVETEHVVIATNGYTSRRISPWHARRLIPFIGYMAATEELSESLLRELIPARRTIVDTNFNIDYFRPAPDSTRLLFGGATGGASADQNGQVERMYKVLIRVFPQLKGVRLSHAWTGHCAGTFDMMPHMGGADGVWYGMGYNFAGVPMGSYFGMRLAQAILGKPLDDSPFATAGFKTIPLYTGRPWFVPMALKYFEWRDRRFALSKAGGER